MTSKPLSEVPSSFSSRPSPSSELDLDLRCGRFSQSATGIRSGSSCSSEQSSEGGSCGAQILGSARYLRKREQQSRSRPAPPTVVGGVAATGLPLRTVVGTIGSPVGRTEDPTRVSPAQRRYRNNYAPQVTTWLAAAKGPGDHPDPGVTAPTSGAWGDHAGVPASDPSSDPASITPSGHHRSARNRANLQVKGDGGPSVSWSDTHTVRVHVHAPSVRVLIS